MCACSFYLVGSAGLDLQSQLVGHCVCSESFYYAPPDRSWGISWPASTRRLLQQEHRKSIVFRAWCSVLVSSSRSGPVEYLYVLQDAFSTSEPLRLYMVAVSVWQPPSQEV
jgi:hypothetical protein